MPTEPAPELEAMETIDLRYLLSLLWHRMWLLALGVGAGALIAFAIGRFQRPVYEAQVQLLLVNTAAATQAQSASQRMDVQQNAQTYADWLAQDWFRAAVSKRLGVPIARGQIAITFSTNSRILHVTVHDADAGTAKSIADAYAGLLSEQSLEIQLNRYAAAEASLDSQIKVAQQDLQGIRLVLAKAEADALSRETAAVQSKIDATRATIGALESKIATLETRGIAPATALAAAGTSGTSLVQMRNDLALQQRLLDAYEGAYVDLQLGGRVKDPPYDVEDLRQTLDTHQQLLAQIMSERQTLALDRLQDVPDVVVLAPAGVPSSAGRPRVLVDTLAGGLAGLVLAAIAVLLVLPADAKAVQTASPGRADQEKRRV